MNRTTFLAHLFAGITAMTTADSLRALSDALPKQDTLMPALFVGHGSPMNALEENTFTQGWREAVRGVPAPAALLCISAHWLTRGTQVTAMEKPKTIHDFGGFPDELYAVQYPAPGSPAIAKTTAAAISSIQVGLDQEWGLDHGTWSVVRHMYPAAQVPVVQLSIDYEKGAQYHYDLAKQLRGLRSKGVLIVGSGNMVHNLGRVDWRNQDRGYDWAEEMNATFKRLIDARNHASLIAYEKLGASARLAIPTPDHYLPLLYILALQGNDEHAAFFNDAAVMGSLTMTSVKIQKG
jgi:4,5-DOPA dioxygenase extradiol